jgi:tetratricopeptide (TPR) repeat protein
MTAGADPLSSAYALLREGRGGEARDLLAPAMGAGLRSPLAHQLMGMILKSLDDALGAERELRAAIRMAPALDTAAQALAQMLSGQGRHEEAADVYAALSSASPDHAGAEFGLASELYRTGREDEAEAAGRRAIDKGLDRIEPWLFLARLLNLQGRLEEAEEAYRSAVGHDPLSVEAQRELAQLVWMRTADAKRACAALDAAPPNANLTAVKVKLLQDAGQEATAYALAAKWAARDPGLSVLAARAALRLHPSKADAHLAAAPEWVNPLARAKAQIETDLALGRAARAAERAEALLAAHPQDHYVTALLATAWRLTGDPRYGQLYDYGRLVKTYRIDPPQGWSDLGAYLADLERALDGLHGLRTHPVGQSLRHGSQTMRSLLDYEDPAIRAFFTAIDAPIRRHVAAVGEGAQDYEVEGAWSVRLNSSGFHTDHVHPDGWLSSAFYVRLPDTLEQDRQGWIKFGQPGTPTRPPLEPEHHVRPEPGLLVLFPSYMWHGTIPFTAQETRLTCAFDLVRKP